MIKSPGEGKNYHIHFFSSHLQPIPSPTAFMTLVTYSTVLSSMFLPDKRWVTASVTTWDLNLHPLTFLTFPLPLSYSAWTEPSALGSYEVKMFHTMEKFFSLFTKIKGGIWTIKGRHVSTEPLSSNSTSCRWSEEDSWLNSNQFKPRIEPATTGFGSSPPAGGAIPLHQSLFCFILLRKAVDSEQHMGLEPWMVELQHHTNPLHLPGCSSQTRFHLPLGPGRGNWTQT